MVKLSLSVLTLFFLVGCSVTGQERLNLDFEDSQLYPWTVSGAGYKTRLDSAIYKSGKQSLCIFSNNSIDTSAYTIGYEDVGIAYCNVPISIVRGKKLVISAEIKTENADSVCFGLTGVSATAIDTFFPGGIKGSKDWRKYTIETIIDSACREATITCMLFGKGTVWIDEVEIEIDGKKYEEPESSADRPTASEELKIEWLKQHISPLTTEEPEAPFIDLEPIRDFVGDATIVGLGEGTHGTESIFA